MQELALLMQMVSPKPLTSELEGQGYPFLTLEWHQFVYQVSANCRLTS